MEYTTLKNTIASMGKGTIHTITYSRPMKTRKGVTDTITKTTTMQCRLGVRYDNMASTKEGRANGTLPTENAGLANSLRWVDDNFIENIYNGNKMLRVAYANGNKTVTKYFVNGVETTKDAIIPLCLASETKPSTSAPTVMNIGVEKIVEIR